MQSFQDIDLPPQVQLRLQELTRRQGHGKLSDSECQELDILTKTKETLMQLRAKAKSLLPTGTSTPLATSRAVRNGLPVVLVPPGTQAIDTDAVRRFLQEAAF
jgi:hypothetical protein